MCLHIRTSLLGFLLVSVPFLQPAVAAEKRADADFGLAVEKMLDARANNLFGFRHPLKSPVQVHVPRVPDQNAYDLMQLVPTLRARILTRSAADKVDMIALWPGSASPTHAMFCIKGSSEVIGSLPSGIKKLNPSVQAVDIGSGDVTTLLRGMNQCSAIHATAWGSLIVTEGSIGGQAYEIINPLGIENHTVIDRSGGVIVDEEGRQSTAVARRDALPRIAWQGLSILDSGVIVGGGEVAFGGGSDESGQSRGILFKFVPETVNQGGRITTLGDSPLVSGTVHALRNLCSAPGTGTSVVAGEPSCEAVSGSWVAVSKTWSEFSADSCGVSGNYSPRDLHHDSQYQGDGVRFCWTDRGLGTGGYHGEVICAVDSDPLLADQLVATVAINRFVEAGTEFNSRANLAFQPYTNNLYLVEERENSGVFACLPDGGDRNSRSDGCLRVLSLKDRSAQLSGLVFFADGENALVSIQHSKDDGMPLFDDYPTDDVLFITGFRVRSASRGWWN